MSAPGEARRTLLLVEDSAAVRGAMSILLDDAGYDVLEAPTGRDALRLAAERRPDVVLVDLGLPDLSGVEVVRRLKAEPSTADVPVVAVTGRDDDDDREACRLAGCVDYLVKPVNTRELVRRIARFLPAER